MKTRSCVLWDDVIVTSAKREGGVGARNTQRRPEPSGSLLLLPRRDRAALFCCREGMAAAQLAPIFAALVPITVLQLVLIHIDHEVPPRCVNLLDINISAHAPRMRIALRAGQRAAGRLP